MLEIKELLKVPVKSRHYNGNNVKFILNPHNPDFELPAEIDGVPVVMYPERSLPYIFKLTYAFDYNTPVIIVTEVFEIMNQCIDPQYALYNNTDGELVSLGKFKPLCANRYEFDSFIKEDKDIPTSLFLQNILKRLNDDKPLTDEEYNNIKYDIINVGDKLVKSLLSDRLSDKKRLDFKN